MLLSEESIESINSRTAQIQFFSKLTFFCFHIPLWVVYIADYQICKNQASFISYAWLNPLFTSKRAQVQDFGPLKNKSTSNFEHGLHFQLSKVRQEVINLIFICILPLLSNPYPNVCKHKLECWSPEEGNWALRKSQRKQKWSFNSFSESKKYQRNVFHFS